MTGRRMTARTAPPGQSVNGLSSGPYPWFSGCSFIVDRSKFLACFAERPTDVGQVTLEAVRVVSQDGVIDPLLDLLSEGLDNVIVLENDAHQLQERLPRAAQE